MPWIAFYSGTRSSDKDNLRHVWYDTIPSEDELKDTAQEMVPEWLKLSECERYHYGYNVVEILPEDVRRNLLKGYEEQRKHADRMIELLRITEIMEG
jgi:hypothetical protein